MIHYIRIRIILIHILNKNIFFLIWHIIEGLLCERKCLWCRDYNFKWTKKVKILVLTELNFKYDFLPWINPPHFLLLVFGEKGL